jgi:hypothetical protein
MDDAADMFCMEFQKFAQEDNLKVDQACSTDESVLERLTNGNPSSVTENVLPGINHVESAIQ